jgi:uncharacterized spore protein YtfJ
MMSDIFSVVESLARGFQDRLSVTTVYGAPVSANGVTVVPVARVEFGFGGGGGGGTGTGPAAGDESVGQSGSGGGGGGGGGGVVKPVGYVEITSQGSRWVAIDRSPTEQLLSAVRSAARLMPRGRAGIALGLFLLVAQLVAGQVSQGRPPADVPFEDITERFG